MQLYIAKEVYLYIRNQTLKFLYQINQCAFGSLFISQNKELMGNNREMGAD